MDELAELVLAETVEPASVPFVEAGAEEERRHAAGFGQAEPPEGDRRQSERGGAEEVGFHLEVLELPAGEATRSVQALDLGLHGLDAIHQAAVAGFGGPQEPVGSSG